MISIKKNDTTPYYQQVYLQIAESIKAGLYHTGERLPSIRQMAAQLGVSRNTIEQAYMLLVQEGYVDSRPGSGYAVNGTEEQAELQFFFSEEYHRQLEALEQACKDDGRSSAESEIRYDFIYDAMDASVFPYALWSRTLRDTLASSAGREICRYADPRGLFELREQLAEYLIREQDVACVPEQVLIMPTTRQMIASLLDLFDRESTVVAVENPGYTEVANQCMRQGYRVVPQTVFPASPWQKFVKSDKGARLLYVTPANQYPTNMIMPLEDRELLVKWAQDSDAYIIEDEYCHEFRYGSAHLPSLHAIDTEGRIITIGTFSKSFAPGVCVCYAVLPPALMQKWMKPGHQLHGPVPWHVQAALAEFFREGYWYRHLHKVQNAARKKYRTLLDAVRAHMGDKVECLDYEVGLHMLVRTTDGRSSAELLETAAQAGVKLYSTDVHWISGKPKDWNYLLMGYSGILHEDIEPGVRALAQAWFG